ncbi:MAG: phage portal protein family protein [Thermoanaerobaculia bacterium]
MSDPVIYDAAGYPVRTVRRGVPDASSTLVIKTRDPWSGKTAGELTPELAAQVLRPNASLQKVMLVAKAELKNEHVAATMRNYVRSVTRVAINGWSVAPFDDKSALAKRQAEEARKFVESIPRITKLWRYWLYGDFYPVSGAGLFWSRDLKRLATWSKVHPSRWTWDYAESRLKILTGSGDWQGTSIEDNRRAYGLYFADDQPGTIVEQGHWWPVLWMLIISLASWGAWVRFADEYGDPSLIAILARGEDEDSVFEAVSAMAGRARGVFPPGTDVKMLEAQRYGTSSLHQAIITMAYKGISKLILGHSLSIDAEGDTGTLAGGHAENVSQQNIEAGCDNLAEGFTSEVFSPWCEWQFGEEAVAAGEVPGFAIISEQPEDSQKKATKYESINRVLASNGRAIAPDQVEEEFEVRTVPLAGATGEPARQEEAATLRRAANLLRTSARFNSADEERALTLEAQAEYFERLAGAAGRPKLATAAQLSAAQRSLIAAGARKMSEDVIEILRTAGAETDLAEALWESYASFTPATATLASGLRDTTIALHLEAQAEVAGEV